MVVFWRVRLLFDFVNRALSFVAFLYGAGFFAGQLMLEGAVARQFSDDPSAQQARSATG